MVLVFILFSCSFMLLLILLYQRSLNKNPLQKKNINQLCQMRHQASVKYTQAKEMKLYGVMGYEAQVMVTIDKELGQRALLHKNQTAVLLKDTVKLKAQR